MNEIQNRYIKNQIKTMPMKLTSELCFEDIKFNKRFDYENITFYIDNFLKGDALNRFLLLPGLRDIGKTTLLFQVYEYLFKEKGITPQNILYFSCDKLKMMGNPDILDAVNLFFKSYHNPIMNSLSEHVFILIDDAQHDKNWSLNGKRIFDASKNIFTIFTGSPALEISNNPDDRKRLLKIPVNILTYSKHLKLKYGNFKNDISKALIQMIF